jgi:hypothetical protein
MDNLIPLAAIFCIFGLPVLAWLGTRAMAHRERMELLRQGVVPDKLNRSQQQSWTASAPAATPVPRASSSCGSDDEWTPESARQALRKAITITMIGFALTIGLSFIGLDGDEWHPGPWLLGGLIPLFVGLAQLIMAVLSGATLRPSAQTWSIPPGAQPPPYTPTPPPNGATTYDGSYTYRPGSTQELRPPTSPPERR